LGEAGMAETEKRAQVLEALLPRETGSLPWPLHNEAVLFVVSSCVSFVKRTIDSLRLVWPLLRLVWPYKFTILYAAWSVAALTYAHRTLEHEELEKQEVAFLAGGLLVSLTVPLAAWLSWEHLTNFVEPRQQSQTVRIIWTVPVYSLSAWLCLRFPGRAIYIHGVRELYEAYVIYCFLQYLVFYLGTNRLELARTLARKPSANGVHRPPFCCLAPWAMGLEFLDNCKLGVLQLVMVRTLTTLGSALCHYQGVYEAW